MVSVASPSLHFNLIGSVYGPGGNAAAAPPPRPSLIAPAQPASSQMLSSGDQNRLKKISDRHAAIRKRSKFPFKKSQKPARPVLSGVWADYSAYAKDIERESTSLRRNMDQTTAALAYGSPDRTEWARHWSGVAQESWDLHQNTVGNCEQLFLRAFRECAQIPKKKKTAEDRADERFLCQLHKRVELMQDTMQRDMEQKFRPAFDAIHDLDAKQLHTPWGAHKFGTARDLQLEAQDNLVRHYDDDTLLLWKAQSGALKEDTAAKPYTNAADTVQRDSAAATGPAKQKEATPQANQGHGQLAPSVQSMSGAVAPYVGSQYAAWGQFQAPTYTQPGYPAMFPPQYPAMWGNWFGM
eukprot:TRINITY_DN27751_c0_g1_i1.p1 TRINITY_DN27751_c0_g1~~TRINITY_DN27751_c0_g1_i1.p1  ORF type:complete len:353 (-),score=42.40 TRINITY_DN27751_c0_g1_i1:67-1125(-)